MTEELKTLNEIWNIKEEGSPGCDDCDVGEKFIKTKEEAIKWVKHIKKDIEILRSLEVPTCYRFGNLALKGLDEVLEGQVVWIINFFNLTGDDLEPHLFIEDDIIANQDLEKSRGINISQVFDDELDKLTDKNISKICKKQNRKV